MFLADTSAWTNVYRSEASWHAWSSRLRAGQVQTCAPIVIELLRGTRDRAEYQRTKIALGSIEDVQIPPDAWARAIDVQSLLEARGMHRGVSLVDLVIAATAERAQTTVLHYDKDFDLIAEVTGQPMEWIAPRGTL